MFRLPGPDHWRGLLVLLLLLIGLQQGLAAALIQAKAWLAPVLIERAWQQSLRNAGIPVRPWPWADTWPVVRLRAPDLEVDLLVLAGDSGNALAFGPGLAWASPDPGTGGTVVIAGHRDTHFAFLEELKQGEELTLVLGDGSERRYRVENARIVNADEETLPVARYSDSLMLVTCYPFNALRVGGPLRYIVQAYPV
jgi:sortase A